MTSKKIIVWAFLGPHTGDNNQVDLLAKSVCEALLCELVFKKLSIEKSLIPNFVRRASIAMLPEKDKKEISGPWPDLVIFAGKRAVGVAKWVQKKSGGKTKLVAIGRPRAPLSWFDLIITTPQYGLPRLDNVIEMVLPVVRPVQKNEPAPNEWSNLKKPWVGVLVGGGRLPLLLNQRVAQKLVERVGSVCKQSNGSWLVSTSPRTDMATCNNLEKHLSGPGFLYKYDGGEMVHQAILAHAERFIVTGDSATMIAEAAYTQKPVEVIPLAQVPGIPAWKAKRGVGRWLAKKGILTPPRDMQLLINQMPVQGDRVETLASVVARIIALFN